MAYVEIGDWQPYDRGGRRKYVNADEGPRFLIEADQLQPDQRAFCHVLAFTGCRVSEVLELSIQRLDVQRCALIVRTLKRRRLVFRVVPIPEFLVTMLLELPRDKHGRWWQKRSSVVVSEMTILPRVFGSNVAKSLRQSCRSHAGADRADNRDSAGGALLC
jgi:integrase